MASEQAHQTAQDRVESFRKAYNSQDLETLMSTLDESKIIYSDNAPGAINLDAAGCRGLFGAMYACIKDIEFKTNNVTSTDPSFICWEFTMEGKYVGTFPGFPEADGSKTFKLVGVSMQWWNEAGTKIEKMTDYGGITLVGADGKEQRV